MGRDKVVAHVIGVAGGVADTLQSVDLGQRADQPGQRHAAVIGVDVLTQ